MERLQEGKRCACCSNCISVGNSAAPDNTFASSNANEREMFESHQLGIKILLIQVRFTVDFSRDWRDQGRALMASALALWRGRLQSCTYQYSNNNNGSHNCTMWMMCLVMTNPHWIITQFYFFLALGRCSVSFIFLFGFSGPHLCFHLLTFSSSRQLFTHNEIALRKPCFLPAQHRMADNASI